MLWRIARETEAEVEFEGFHQNHSPAQTFDECGKSRKDRPTVSSDSTSRGNRRIQNAGPVRAQAIALIFCPNAGIAFQHRVVVAGEAESERICRRRAWSRWPPVHQQNRMHRFRESKRRDIKNVPTRRDIKQFESTLTGALGVYRWAGTVDGRRRTLAPPIGAFAGSTTVPRTVAMPAVYRFSAAEPSRRWLRFRRRAPSRGCAAPRAILPAWR